MGHPNFFEMFLHWLHPELDGRERKKITESYEKKIQDIERKSTIEHDNGISL